MAASVDLLSSVVVLRPLLGFLHADPFGTFYLEITASPYFPPRNASCSCPCHKCVLDFLRESLARSDEVTRAVIVEFAILASGQLDQ